MSEARKMSSKVKLEPEVTFFDGPPSWTEVILPTISILTVIGTLRCYYEEPLHSRDIDI